MRDTRSWQDEEIEDDLRQLLRAAPVPRAMTAPERARSARALRSLTALPVAAGMMFWIKNVALAGVLGAVGGLVVSGAVVLVTNPDAPSVASPAVAPPSPVPVIAPIPSAPAAVATPAAPEEPKRALPVASSSASSSTIPEPSDSLALETQKLEAARKVLATDPNRALLLLAAHAQEFPGGKLAGERELLAIDALGRAGRKPEARGRAEAMLNRQPNGLYAERLRRMLAQLQ
jgi:hypothetical protein